MSYQHIELAATGSVAHITMNRPTRRNALSREHMLELIDAFQTVGRSSAKGIVLAGRGPVFCAGHDFADLVGADLESMRSLLQVCVELMQTIQSVPQVVLAKVHALATAAGCQMVATCDLAVAADSAAFALPGGKGAWFCHTPLVAVARSLPPKRALEMAFTGDEIDARTALEWGFINRCVPAADLDSAAEDLLARATRSTRFAKGLGKRTYYAQAALPQAAAYAHALEVMASHGQTEDAQERMRAFVEKRPPQFKGV